MPNDRSKTFLLFEKSGSTSPEGSVISQTCVVSKEDVINNEYKAYTQRMHRAQRGLEVRADDLLEAFKKATSAIPCAHPRSLVEPYCWMPIESLPPPEDLGSVFVLVSAWVDSDTFKVSPAIYGRSLVGRLLNQPPKLINPYLGRPLDFSPEWWCRPVPPPQ